MDWIVVRSDDRFYQYMISTHAQCRRYFQRDDSVWVNNPSKSTIQYKLPTIQYTWVSVWSHVDKRMKECDSMEYFPELISVFRSLSMRGTVGWGGNLVSWQPHGSGFASDPPFLLCSINISIFSQILLITPLSMAPITCRSLFAGNGSKKGLC